MTTERRRMFHAPTWLRDLGFASWLLVGFAVIVVAVIALMAATATIVMPVILAAVLGAVSGPVVSTLNRHRVPRAAGAAIVLLALAAIALAIVLLIVSGITSQSDNLSSDASDGLDKIDSWFQSLGAGDTSQAKQGVKDAVPDVLHTLVHGISHAVGALSSLVFFLSFAALATFFILKDGPVMHRFINRHLGVDEDVANTITTRVATSLRQYFAGVTIIAGFNGLVVGLGALILGVPLVGTIVVVTFVCAYVPFVGAWAAGAFAVILALGTQGTTAAIILTVIVLLANGLLQNILQPFVFGATLSLNPLVVLVVTIGAGCLFGMVGLTLAAPLTSAAVHISNELRGELTDEGGPEPEALPSG